MRSSGITIRLNRSNTAKIQVIQEAAGKTKTVEDILDELLDIGYAEALETLYRQKRISSETYRIGLSQLPKHLRIGLADKFDGTP